MNFQSAENLSGGSFGKNQRFNINIDKAQKIRQSLDFKGVIIVSKFLNRMVLPNNNTFTGMENEDNLFDKAIYLE